MKQFKYVSVEAQWMMAKSVPMNWGKKNHFKWYPNVVQSSLRFTFLLNNNSVSGLTEDDSRAPWATQK